MNFNLNNPVIIQQEINAVRVETRDIIDNGMDQTVKANIILYSADGEASVLRSLTLWEGQEYLDIGQWTDSDVASRINSMLSV